ncbi:MAG: C40 family peptidase [Acidobacteriota bacterium]|nr:C40 family peptidase [Acidobacteriota bacterium]
MKKLFPYALAACFSIGMLPQPAAAQSLETRQRQVAQSRETYNLSAVDNDPVIISLAAAEDIKASKSFAAAEDIKALKSSGGTSGGKRDANFQFQQLVTAAIDERLGARYVWGATGPSAYDCSGFVWSTFRSAGIDFERSSARTLWARFSPPAPGEQYKFGTLVFFSNLAHIGIVADEHGFYHASRHHGVVYSPFNEYWLSRVDGFRRVPLPARQITD